MIVGYRLPGSISVALAANTKVVSGFYNPVARRVSKVGAYLDGLAGGLGVQTVRAVVYGSGDALLAVSDEVTVESGAEGTWSDFTFSSGPAFVLPQGDFAGGLLAGEADGVVRWSKVAAPDMLGGASSGSGSRENANVYTDGPSDPFGATTTSDRSVMSWYAEVFEQNLDVLPDMPDLYYARLPYDLAQEIFGNGTAENGSAARTRVGWHHTFTDPEQGSNALVRDGGPLMGLLGERIKIHANRRTVYAYVHGILPADELDDISVTRLLYAKLSTLSDDNVPATIEVMA